MEVQIVQWLILAAFGAVGWFMRRTIDKVETEQKEQAKELVTIKTQYLHKDEFKEFKQELRSMFEEIKSDIRSLQK